VATLERRVPVLFDPRQYDALQQLAQAERRSIGSIIREAVDQRLSARQSQRQAIGERLIASARSQHQQPASDWDEIKASFERQHLEGIG
jgi:predicted transcriptional regulator